MRVRAPRITRKRKKDMSPLVGKRKEIGVMRDGKCIKLLLDTGAATSLISSRRANDLRLKTYDTSPVTIRGATTNARGVPYTKATVLTFTYNAFQYDIPIYVGDELHTDIIIDNPVLEFYPELGQLTTNMSPVTLEPSTPQTCQTIDPTEP
ncbi:hypothetical protein HG536_0A02750 [Torulaspora globosa]|uniref:Peptidase A2B Ty3 transposon peptidase domain-containing protein n=1 Tax=Torulaspora globosa TaxID=48254 RepID=A0A7G3ZAC2_9SACH|nr:uncharacterized protein HG536_0A02750 [Torulaspora globosa]QLL30458.1 hypothetical protein HG536_0A02750 [Torulaspora globosa]